jgi:hypothetical protein
MLMKAIICAYSRRAFFSLLGVGVPTQAWSNLDVQKMASFTELSSSGSLFRKDADAWIELTAMAFLARFGTHSLLHMSCI